MWSNPAPWRVSKMSTRSSGEKNRDTIKHYYDVMYDRSVPNRYLEDQEEADRAAELKRKTLSWLEKLSSATDVSVRTVLELGCGNGSLREVHHRWIGLELSFRACKNAMERGADRLVTSDLQRLPFGDNSVDVVITWATLEHIARPDIAIQEMVRVIRPGGALILGPSWHCRSWTVKRLPFRMYGALAWRQKIAKATIPVRELLFWRVLSSLPFRLGRELKLAVGAEVAFRFQALEPELDTSVPHVSDDDAFASIDSHMGICYFVSHGWRCISHSDVFRRVLARHEEVVVIKPLARRVG